VPKEQKGGQEEFNTWITGLGSKGKNSELGAGLVDVRGKREPNGQFKTYISTYKKRMTFK